MRLSSLELDKFRNYSHLDQEFFPGAQVLYGKNAQGKTNILEAIYLCTCARSHRTGKDIDLVKNGESEYRVKINFVTEDDNEEEIIVHYLAPINNTPLRSKSYRHIYHNGIKLEKLSEMMGLFHAVIFAPEDLQIVKEGPSARRRFLDLLISQLNSVYFRELQKYQHILSQRNKLLKKLRENKNIRENPELNKLHLEIWNEQLSKTAANIIWERRRIVEKISTLAQAAQLEISENKENLEIRYKTVSSLDEKLNINEIKETLYKKYGMTSEDDIFRGSTGLGPHRDDLIIYLNGEEVKPYASQGQQRSVVLSLKIAELLLIKEMTGEPPILLLDDVMSELDSNRRESLIKVIKGHQVFITCTDISQVMPPDGSEEDNLENIAIYSVNNAEVEQK